MKKDIKNLTVLVLRSFLRLEWNSPNFQSQIYRISLNENHKNNFCYIISSRSYYQQMINLNLINNQSNRITKKKESLELLKPSMYKFLKNKLANCYKYSFIHLFTTKLYEMDDDAKKIIIEKF
jgi:hypothetical protein